VPEAKRVLSCVAEALAAAHREGIVHRDLRPSNVLIEDDSGRVLISDFGLAAVLDTGSETVQRITKTGQIVGDAFSMSPEQIRGEKVTGQADVYQIGVLAYYLLTGEGPFGAGAPARIMAAHLEDEPRELTKLRMVVDPSLSGMARRCLDKRPNRRPTAADVVRFLKSPEAGDVAAGGDEPLDLLRRRLPQFVVAAIIAGVGVLGAVDQLTQHDLLPQVVYPLTLIFVLHGVAATAVVSWFHGARGKQRVVAWEIVVLVLLTASWLALSVWTFMRR
jgi:serine/threonine protein kinase